jgi:hypothetical protein
MSLLDTLDRKFGRYGVPNVTVGLIACQVVTYLLSFAPAPAGAEPVVARLMLIPDRVAAGEYWRLATFLIMPPSTNLLFAFFFWYLFYLMGTALEHQWGTFRYNVYLLIGYVAAVAASLGLSFLLGGDIPATNAFLEGSVFLAFAYLFPDFEMYIFFLLPVKIKWLALLTWIGFFFVLLFGEPLTRVLVVASVCNFLLFFGKDIWHRARAGRRRMAHQAARLAVKEPAYYHRCVVCGITDRTHPQMDFRYCSKCAGARCYCAGHLRDHEHVAAAEPAPER